MLMPKPLAPMDAAPQPSVINVPLFRAAMRRFSAACTIITTAIDGDRAGLTATAVCSLTADPASLLVCINRSTYAHGLIERAGALSVNVLARDQEQIARRFAGMVPGVAPETRFEEGQWIEGETGMPVLAGSMASFECRVRETLLANTHSIFICEVAAATIPEGKDEPLIYFDGRFASLS